MSDGLLQSQLKSLPLLSRGKVRDIYDIDEHRLLIVQSDRISAFDVVMHQPVPHKGQVLTEMSAWWFRKMAGIVSHHLLPDSLDEVLGDEADRKQVAQRCMLVKKLKPLPIEAVCRGYIIGSGWKDYCKTGRVCGIELPTGLGLAEQLPEVIFTPATKARMGEHDENISFDSMANIVGLAVAQQIREISIKLYKTAADLAIKKGIIIADTKFEFAVDDAGTLVLIDEVLTPDSSRYWVADSWAVGKNPDSYDKQFLRDWLETTAWDKKAPPPTIPAEVIAKTTAKYLEIKDILLAE